MLAYDFMVRALLASVIVSLTIPFIGVVIVLRRLSNIGEALSHTSLAGVAIGLIFGWSPMVTSILICIVASVAIEWVRRAFPKYAEIAVNVTLSAGIGLVALLSGNTGSGNQLSSYLFGSVVAVTQSELIGMGFLGGVVIFFSLACYRALFAVTFDEENARLMGIPVDVIHFLFAVMAAIVVAVAARTIGALIVTSLIVLPVACALALAKSYRGTMVLSIGFALFFTLTGLTLSFYLDLKPGGTMALTGVATLLLLLPFTRRRA